MRFRVHIEEILTKDIIVEAETRQDVRAMIEERINNEDIVLTADDYSGCRMIEVMKEDEY